MIYLKSLTSHQESEGKTELMESCGFRAPGWTEHEADPSARMCNHMKRAAEQELWGFSRIVLLDVGPSLHSL